jgi:hypothetical protein
MIKYKKVDECNTWGDNSSNVLANEEIDKQAKDIQQQEAQVKDVWIQDHALVDEDGRTRCSFYFCRNSLKTRPF